MAGQKRVSQETFDDAVRENMEDFGMSREDAVNDTIEQFKLQGIDLSNIVTSTSGVVGEDHPIVASAKRLTASVEAEDTEGIQTEIANLMSMTPQEAEGKTMAGNAGAVEACATALCKFKSESGITFPILRLIELLILQNDINRDRLKLPLSKPNVVCVVEALKELPDDAAVQEVGFKVAKIAATKSESLKATLMEYGIMRPMNEALRRHLDKFGPVIAAVASTIRTVTNADDWSTMMSKVFDTSKDLVKGGVLPLLYAAMRAHAKDPDILQELLASLKGCAVQDDIVKGMMKDGGLSLALAAFKEHMLHAGVATRCMLLLANLAENDDVKKFLCEDEALPLMLTAMQTHEKSPRVMRAGFAALASMALRMSDNTEKMVEAGTVHVLVEGMRAHAAHSELNRQGMIAIRNMVVRCPHHRAAFLNEGAEELIVTARDTHIKCADAAFDCLRDLGCEYGGLGDMAGKGKHSAYVTCGDSLLSKAGQMSAGSSMVTWEEDD